MSCHDQALADHEHHVQRFARTRRELAEAMASTLVRSAYEQRRHEARIDSLRVERDRDARLAIHREIRFFYRVRDLRYVSWTLHAWRTIGGSWTLTVIHKNGGCCHYAGCTYSDRGLEREIAYTMNLHDFQIFDDRTYTRLA